MILSCINIRKVPREMLKTSLGTLRMLMNGKSCLIPIFQWGCDIVFVDSFLASKTQCFFFTRYGGFSFGTERTFVPPDFGSSSPTLFRTLAVRGTALVSSSILSLAQLFVISTKHFLSDPHTSLPVMFRHFLVRQWAGYMNQVMRKTCLTPHVNNKCIRAVRSASLLFAS